MGSWGKNRRRVVAQQKTFRVTVHAFEGDPSMDSKIQGARVVWDGQTPGEGVTDGAGNFTLPPQKAAGFNITVSGGQTDPPLPGTFGDHWIPVTAVGDQDLDFELPFDLAQVSAVPGRPIISPLQRVRVVGRIFRTADGAPWRKKFCSAFFALQRWDLGEDCEALVDWTHEVGGNGWRVFCQFLFANKSDPLKPGQIPPERMAAFADWMLARGLYVGFVFKTDTQADGFNESLYGEIADVRNIIAALARCENVVGELKNEPWKNGKRINEIVAALRLRDKINRPFPLATGDYNIVGNEDGFYALDWIGDHPPRKADWPAEAGKTGHFIYDGWPPDENSPGWKGFKGQDVAIDADEPYGCAEAFVPGRRDNSPNNFEDAGGGFGMGGSGLTFHADDLAGRFQVPGPVQTACAIKYFAAADFFPADAFLGDYSHDGFPNFPLKSIATHMQDASEVAGRVFANRAYVVAAQPSNAWLPEPQNGWRIVKQGGHRGNLLILER